MNIQRIEKDIQQISMFNETPSKRGLPDSPIPKRIKKPESI